MLYDAALERIRFDNQPPLQRVPGRLAFVTHMGNTAVRAVLPALVDAVGASGHPVIWQCDPMKENTVTLSSGYQTCDFDR
ncbi:3-deoxy-7-phosphoheptulonate synthase, partial [Mycobacterium simiae]|uniref:3-deoxy-7-phosphoheptulonate synthase n=1 Tax=Mycobacterium simiae TaxID=1784 RepID=UPI0033A887F2